MGQEVCEVVVGGGGGGEEVGEAGGEGQGVRGARQEGVELLLSCDSISVIFEYYCLLLLHDLPRCLLANKPNWPALPIHDFCYLLSSNLSDEAWGMAL